MSSHQHHIKRCRCGKVISQCRCPDPNKTVIVGVCDDCKDKPAMTDHNDAIERAVGRLPADMDMMDVEHIRPILRDLVAEVRADALLEGEDKWRGLYYENEDALARIVELCEEGLLDGEIVVLAETILALAREGGEWATLKAANVSAAPDGSVEAERAPTLQADNAGEPVAETSREPAAPDLRELREWLLRQRHPEEQDDYVVDGVIARLDRIEAAAANTVTITADSYGEYCEFPQIYARITCDVPGCDAEAAFFQGWSVGEPATRRCEAHREGRGE